MPCIRQQIVDAIETRLKQIAPGKVWQLPDGPYTCSSALLDIYPWRKTGFSLNQVPAVAFWDTTCKTVPGPSRQHEHRLTVPVEGWLAGGSSITTARELMADLIATVISDLKWGGLARWTEIYDSEPDVNQAGDTISAVQVNLIVIYRTPYGRI